MTNRQLVITDFSTDIDKAVSIKTGKVVEPNENEVVIKTSYVGINALYDRELYRGAVPYINVTFPYIYGVESVGVIHSVGSAVTSHQLGDTVSVVKVGSAYQEYQTVPAEYAINIPQASPAYLAINPTGISAHLAIEKVGEVQPGETVLVTAAAGGLGHFIAQLCKHKGCHVIATCGHDEKVDLLEKLGCCDRIIQYNREEVAVVLDQEYKDRIDVAFDSVGGSMFDAILPQLAQKGRLVICGLAAELSRSSFEIIEAPRAYESIYWKGASIRCFMNHLYKDEHPLSRDFLTQLYQSSQLSVLVDPSPFNGVNSIIQASKYLLGGNSRGKVVVALL